MVKALKRLKPGQAGTKKVQLKPDQVLVKFPTAKECFDNQNCISFKVDVDFISFAYESQHEDEYLNIPLSVLGKEVTLNKNNIGGYYEHNHYIQIAQSQVKHFHDLVKFIKGEQIYQSLTIDGDELTYDEENKEFNVGCKTIDDKLANEIFHFIGKKLGYQITE